MKSNGDWTSDLAVQRDVSASMRYEPCNQLEIIRIGWSPTRTKFLVGTTTALPVHAPPPKLHYSTWWRKITRRLYEDAHEERAEANRMLLRERAAQS